MPEIERLLTERRRFPPPPEFARRAVVDAKAEARLRKAAEEDVETFWANEARARVTWAKPFARTLSWNPPFARWFEDGELNVSENCLDRHLAERGAKPAIVWEGEPGDARTLTYAELARDVNRFANGLAALGIGRGDRVAIYMPMVPEAAVAMLACARLGATHSVVFGGFSAEALKDRCVDAGAKAIITADGGFRKGAVVPLKANADVAAAGAPTVERVVVLERAKNEIAWHDRDVAWSDVVKGQSSERAPEPLPAEHPLFILYTSGSTGKPKGILHTTGGYLVGAATTTQWVFDLREDDVYWCTADIGWVTGHSYGVYGPLALGATTVMYEGAPMTPTPDRWWDIVERRRVTVFYTAPTAIRAFMRLGDAPPKAHDLSSLRLLGTVGEPINPEAWMWYRDTIGGGRCPVVDTWWQTETGAIVVSPLPGATETKPGSATKPLPGYVLDVVDRQGRPVGPDEGGFLVIRKPWPSMLRAIWGDDERYRKQYWSDVPGVYFTGDAARRDKDGDLWIMGRVDDVLNVAGHRLSTMEIESALVSHPIVAEAAVVGRPDPERGQAVVAFVTLKRDAEAGDGARSKLCDHVAKQIGPIARPAEIRFAEALPKTRSGKIMRRLLRDVAAGAAVKGDVTTLEDFTVLERLRAGEED
ncbi:MAG TPA: acetate--CoA ligase [Candidatus Thermoplasmatota archaeon]|nr:acetate--CoA ligase [Candidatus Thermoplasmatota archaeon]